MTMEANGAAAVHQVALDGELTIFTAEAIKLRLQEAVAAGQDLEIDLSHVTEMDSAGLQLMIAAKRQAQHLGKELHFVNHSAPVQNVLDLCDLVGHFGDPVVLFSSRKAETEANV